MVCGIIDINIDWYIEKHTWYGVIIRHWYNEGEQTKNEKNNIDDNYSSSTLSSRFSIVT